MNWESFLSIFSPLLFYPGCPNFILPSRSNHTSTLSDFHHPEKVCAGLAMCCTCNVLDLQCPTLPMSSDGMCSNVLLSHALTLPCSHSQILSHSPFRTQSSLPWVSFSLSLSFSSFNVSWNDFSRVSPIALCKSVARRSQLPRVSPVTLLHFSIDSSNVSRECRPSLSAR